MGDHLGFFFVLLCDKCIGMLDLHDESIKKRFWEKVDKTEDCWLWFGAHNEQGYGRIRINKKSYYAHRLQMIWLGKDLPDGHHVDHLCRNPACVRPDHLEVVTHKENIRRGDWSANRKRLTEITHCKYGHPYDRLMKDRPNVHGIMAYYRTCSECGRIRAREYQRRKRAK